MQIQPAIGAEEIINFCGGLDWVLKALGCNFNISPVQIVERLPLKAGPCSPPGREGLVKSITLDLAKYEDIVAPIKNQKRHGMKLLSLECCIPAQVLTLLRFPPTPS